MWLASSRKKSQQVEDDSHRQKAGKRNFQFVSDDLRRSHWEMSRHFTLDPDCFIIQGLPFNNVPEFQVYNYVRQFFSEEWKRHTYIQISSFGVIFCNALGAESIFCIFHRYYQGILRQKNFVTQPMSGCSLSF